MRRNGPGWFECLADDLGAGTRYKFVLDGKKIVADPASAYQPEGVFGPSEIVDHTAFSWGEDEPEAWGLSTSVLYEMHVGTFTSDGTFDAAADRLHLLRDMGIDCIQLLPVSQFSGRWNWGRDGVFPYAVHAGYGGPFGLKRFVRTAHSLGMKVMADMAFERLWSEGGVLGDVGRYLRRDGDAPGGRGINYDGSYSYGVRAFFVQSVLYWLEKYHLDGVRLVGTDTINDRGGIHFLEELSGAVQDYEHDSGRRCMLLTGNNRGNTREIMPVARGGYGVDAMLNRDFQSALHVAVVSESNGPYGEFSGLNELAAVLNHGIRFDGGVSSWWKRRQGRNSDGLEGDALIGFTQNSCTLGERAGGERSASLLSLEGQKLAAGCLMLAPFVPMLFMGQEYGETAPFRYFTDFSSESARSAVEKERARKLRPYKWRVPAIPPTDEQAFLSSVLNWEHRFTERGRMMVDFHAELLRMRREIPGLAGADLTRCEARTVSREVLFMLRHSPAACCKAAVVFNFGDSVARIDFSGLLPNGEWTPAFNSADEKWGGSGPSCENRILCGECLDVLPKSFCVYVCNGFN